MGKSSLHKGTKQRILCSCEYQILMLALKKYSPKGEVGSGRCMERTFPRLEVWSTTVRIICSFSSGHKVQLIYTKSPPRGRAAKQALSIEPCRVVRADRSCGRRLALMSGLRLRTPRPEQGTSRSMLWALLRARGGLVASAANKGVAIKGAISTLNQVADNLMDGCNGDGLINMAESRF